MEVVYVVHSLMTITLSWNEFMFERVPRRIKKLRPLKRRLLNQPPFTRIVIADLLI